jgi:phenylalanyl-tRNA synthetase beta subunit
MLPVSLDCPFLITPSSCVPYVASLSGLSVLILPLRLVYPMLPVSLDCSFLITPSPLGVVREVSANYELPFELPSFSIKTQVKSSINTSVSNTTACPKYLTRSILGIDNTVKTPQWMVDKLIRSGQAIHSPVVDITNFVLMELGQPMHAFDATKIKGESSK